MPPTSLILIQSVKHLGVLLIKKHLHINKGNTANKYNTKPCYKYPQIAKIQYQPIRLENNLSLIIWLSSTL